VSHADQWAELAALHAQGKQHLQHFSLQQSVKAPNFHNPPGLPRCLHTEQHHPLARPRRCWSSMDSCCQGQGVRGHQPDTGGRTMQGCMLDDGHMHAVLSKMQDHINLAAGRYHSQCSWVSQVVVPFMLCRCCCSISSNWSGRSRCNCSGRLGVAHRWCRGCHVRVWTTATGASCALHRVRLPPLLQHLDVCNYTSFISYSGPTGVKHRLWMQQTHSSCVRCSAGAHLADSTQCDRLSSGRHLQLAARSICSPASLTALTSLT